MMKKTLCILLIMLLFCTAGCQTKSPDGEEEGFGNTVLDLSPDDADPNTEEDPAPSEESDTPDDHTHDWENATCTESKTCTDCGDTDGKALGHDFKGTSCTTAGKCSRCGETEKATGHQYSGGICKTCGAKEAAENPPTEEHTHTWVTATCLAPKTCRDCGETAGTTADHTKAPATCAEGETCTVCKAAFSEPLGHAFVNDTCKKCNETVQLPFTVEYEKNLSYNGVKFTVLQCNILDIDLLEKGECQLEVFTQSISGGENRFRVIFTDAEGIIISETTLGSASVPGDTQLNSCPIPVNAAAITVTFA